MKTNIIYNDDCLNVIKKLPNNEFLLVTDPPYGINWNKQCNKRHRKDRVVGDVDYGWKKYDDFNWDSEPPNEECFKELLRISKNQIIWGGNYFTDKLYPSQGWLIWNKCQRSFSCADAEMAWTSFDVATRIFDFSRGAHKAEGERLHPTQKPLALLEWCIKLRAKKGDIIIDPFMGSGTTCVAAQNLGFDFIGIEKDKKMFNVAKNRLGTKVKGLLR